MPGLIDAHIHAYSVDVDIQASDRYPLTYVSHDARRMLEESLDRGFTSVRDTGGADHGLSMAIERGLVRGPRLFYCGKALSQTGGHGDFRRPGEQDPCSCGGYKGHLSTVVDGVDDVRRAIRDELRQGAQFIKIFASGGVASTGDPLDSIQFSAEEVLAAVDEVERHGTYVTAHVHPDAALRRAVELGVHCIEHGTFISDETAVLAAERETSIVPTLAVIKALATYGREMGFPDESLEKLAIAEPRALGSLEIMQRAGVQIGFGSDLLGDLDRHQCTEFTIRREVFGSIDILRSATSVNARIIGEGDRLGVVAPGFAADLIVVDGDPLTDITLFDEQGSKVPIVMKGGTLVKSTMS
jgi:imidazolonepropionase-like amidohydrolase